MISQKVDQVLLELDGTKNKSKLGANAILAVSMANMVAYAKSEKNMFMNLFLTFMELRLYLYLL